MATDPLNILKVIQKLEVGPVKIEKKRFVAPYRLVQNNNEDSIDLIYHYDEPVFSPGDLNSQNLANMIAAQVALNYGLFCEEIHFHGYFDKADQKFLNDMAINTACEIYVKKFLEPNPFLIGDAANLPVIEKENYLHAKLIFDDADTTANTPPWPIDRGKICILSSGGKDSLISYGLLEELNYSVHPIFVNESGRHWYTALNGYRYLKSVQPNTSRVWTNADRIFNWMLRRMPFIRKDFARLRSDEYPIRLWTVAVFLFGVLPLVQKRGLGRIIIGDEFDTSRKVFHKGIMHYDGLYDQSRYFDNAMSEYYHQKNWGISQFSIIRQLSELLIIKILAQRYPELQSHQVSCHAAHIENDRVYPCGNCEKCRRIVGMLTAIGAEPKRCGYKKEQIARCLKDVPVKSLHQESESAQHLIYLLQQQRLIPESTPSIEPHEEVLKIRIYPECSPIETVPQELRKPLFQIWLEYAQGAIRKVDNKWVEFDLLNDSALDAEFPFENP